MMISLVLFAAAAVASAPADPIDRAAIGLVAEIEDDKGPDSMLIRLSTSGCTTRVIARDKEWVIDWTRSEGAFLEDTFVYVSTPPGGLAIVGDASKPDQAEKLRALATAMLEATYRCGSKPAPI